MVLPFHPCCQFVLTEAIRNQIHPVEKFWQNKVGSSQHEVFQNHPNRKEGMNSTNDVYQQLIVNVGAEYR